MAMAEHPKAALEMSKKHISAHYNSAHHGPQVDIPLHQMLLCSVMPIKRQSDLVFTSKTNQICYLDEL